MVQWGSVVGVMTAGPRQWRSQFQRSRRLQEFRKYLKGEHVPPLALQVFIASLSPVEAEALAAFLKKGRAPRRQHALLDDTINAFNLWVAEQKRLLEKHSPEHWSRRGEMAWAREA